MTIFQNKNFLFYKSNPLDSSQCQLAFPKLRVFMHLWATDFRVYTARRCTSFQHFYGLSPPMIMSNRECRVFHPGGDLPQLAMPNTHIFIFKTVRLVLEIVPCYLIHHRTPNTVSINHVPMTSHRTPNTVSINHVPMTSHRTPNTLSIFTLHSHPCHAMS